ncbi:hypothetical protein QPL79_05935 [Ignisphaera sp. 4213-co]|uniref:Uncharacterized protein n=1 Tax=Ignisphaera cupida TaxID=3050454 RepID=A0ABD4Z9X4_9CREN|nr:hypothetical protein [Ignisphaera sp. 4213-co]MDK6028898.1 hypothetical protein [Ignisphaera sp. 4213-co]
MLFSEAVTTTIVGYVVVIIYISCYNFPCTKPNEYPIDSATTIAIIRATRRNLDKISP